MRANWRERWPVGAPSESVQGRGLVVIPEENYWRIERAE